MENCLPKTLKQYERVRMKRRLLCLQKLLKRIYISLDLVQIGFGEVQVDLGSFHFSEV